MFELQKYNAKIAFNLHFAPQRIIVSAIIMFFLSLSLTAQQPARPDSLLRRTYNPSDSIASQLLKSVQDTTIRDTIAPGSMKISKDAVDKDITYTAEESIKTDLISKKVYLIKGAKVNYGDIELNADSIVMDMETGSVYATGIPDSTGKLAGRPVFSQGSQEFESNELTYNFKSKKAIIKNIRTEQEGGYLNSTTAKLNNDGTVFVDNSKYSTCDAEEPHFYIKLRKAKFYPGEKIVSGPANLVVMDIPMPLIIPYGFFPIQSKRSSGLILPSFGQEASRGYYLQDGGFYYALNDFFDLKLTGSVYTNGTWKSNVSTAYKMRYRYSGSFTFNYASNISSYKGLSDYSKITNYKVIWNHAQDAKANPSSTFSARVDMSSSGYDKNNSYNINDLNTTTRQSSVSYSKSWSGTPLHFTTSFNQTQNTSTDVISINLPKATLSASRFYPFKPKNPVKSRWYHDIQMQYTANVDNQIKTYDSVLFTNKVWSDMTNGFKHSIPVTIPIKAFSNFTVSPNLTYSGVLYAMKKEKYWDDVNNTVVTDTIQGLYYKHAIVPSLSATYSPSVYGHFVFNDPEAKVQALYHVIKPSVGFSFSPAFAGLSSSDMYKTVQSDSTGEKYSTYSIFEGGIMGTPSLPKRSGNLSFNLDNILEAKVFAKNDTTGKPKKIKLIDNLSAGTSYNLFADSCNWSTVNTRFGTTIAQNFKLDVSSTFDMYALNSEGNKISEFAYTKGQGLARMTNFRLSISFDLAKLINGTGGDNSESSTPKEKKSTGPGNDQDNAQNLSSVFDEYGYVNFDMPWSMRVSYSYNYSKSGFKSNTTNSFTVTGNVKMTPKISLTYSSGYDFVDKELGNTSIGISRDLHCWQMSVSWMPIGTYRSWNFTIRPKSGILQDLKYERKRDYHETY